MNNQSKSSPGAQQVKSAASDHLVTSPWVLPEMKWPLAQWHPGSLSHLSNHYFFCIVLFVFCFFFL